MTTATLDRTTFETPLTGEYFSVAELQTMTGQPRDRFADVVLKELLDNGLDAAEQAARETRAPPALLVRVRARGGVVRLSVRDNGAGIPPETVRSVLNFHTRTSDKAAYRAPTRGAQGNALKTVLGIPYALGSRKPVVIESHGVRHTVRVHLDPVGEVQVRHETAKIEWRPGTRVLLALPASACRGFRPADWATAFALFNPHARVRIRDTRGPGKQGNCPRAKTGKLYRPPVEFPGGRWRKFLPTDLTSPWWYDDKALARLLFGHVALARRGGRDLTLRDFLRQFRGLSEGGKASAVCGEFPALRRLNDFTEAAVPALLRAMQARAKPPSADVLGLVGEEHFHACFDRLFGVKRFWYVKEKGVAGGVPYVFEVALAVTRRPGAFFHGVNFSPTFADPLAGTWLQADHLSAFGWGGFLQNGHAHPAVPPFGGSVAAAVHLVCPSCEVLDKGKTRVRTPPAVTKAMAAALWRAVKPLYREEEQRKKDAARQERADRQHERAERQEKCPLTDAVARVLPEAVAKATGDGTYPVSAHTLFYHVRPLVQPYTSRDLTSHYFEQKLLPAYQRERGPIAGLYYEPRGVLYEPHTGKEVPLGTREVEGYRFPYMLYDKILFVEKTGLWPVFKAARLAERYDMAIVAGEGYATEACRVLFADAENGTDYQLFVAHDADPYGYNIGRILGDRTARMPGHRATVADIGLKLEEALALGLPAENFTRRKAIPQGLKLTALERDYFVGRQAGSKAWVARRVELNALAAPDLIAYVERKLGEAGVRGKVIPPPAALPALAEDVYRGVLGTAVDVVLKRLLDTDAMKAHLAEALRGGVALGQARAWVEQAFAEDSSVRWREAVARQVAEALGQLGLEEAVRAMLARGGEVTSG